MTAGSRSEAPRARAKAPRAIVLASLASGAGKTTLTMGLLAALRARGYVATSAKSGPDYLDPQHHQTATGRPALTLDAFAMPPAEIRARAHAWTGDADLLVIEGAMGLFDGAITDAAFGPGATADVAAALDAPVALILDISKSAHSAAALALGARRLRDDLSMAGVILNRAASARHAAAATRAIAAGAGLEVLAAVFRQEGLSAPSRHLGLVQPEELADHPARLATAAGAFDDAAVARIVAAARPLPAAEAPTAARRPPGRRIAIAQDAAFRFAYPHQLADWTAAGAALPPFSPLADQGPDPCADAVFLPGGYPELHLNTLAAAARFRAGMRAAADRGARIYGECGGYMVLGRDIEDVDGRSWPMLGLLPLVTSMKGARLTLGYRRLRALTQPPFHSARTAIGHEHHHARIVAENWDASAQRLFTAEDAGGRALGAVGLLSGSVSGSFVHVIAPC